MEMAAVILLDYISFRSLTRVLKPICTLAEMFRKICRCRQELNIINSQIFSRLLGREHTELERAYWRIR